MPRVQLHPTRNGLARKFLTESLSIPARLALEKASVLLSLGDTSSVNPLVPHALFVQQAYVAYPHDWRFSASPSLRAKMALMSKYFRMGIKSVDRFVVQTQFMRDGLCENWRIAPERVAVIPSSVDLAAIDSVLLEKPVRSPSPHVVYVASAAAHKHHQIIPDMLRALDRHDVRCTLTLHRGDLPRMERRARELGVLGQIDFVGPRTFEECLRLLATATLSVIPSLFESFGLGYYEALALGVPLVVADLPFAREACGPAARYARWNSAEHYAGCVSELLASELDRQVLSALAQRRFREIHVPWGDVADRFVAELSSIAGRG
ncbi:MAG: glycosyltransferase family 4 protein [Polyangiaceae bacterium]